jgi:hypothetical protein
MKKTVYTLIILLFASSLLAQQKVDGLKITYNDNGIQTQTFQLDSILDWGYDLSTQKVFVNPVKGDKLIIAPSNFFQFEFPKIEVVFKKDVFSGYVQKGPYVNGSSVIITQLDENLNQTGNVFSTQIIDNSGNFEERHIDFTSNFVELKADGYYFNEVKGENSSSQLTLYALVDISDVNSVNVNILTHLERQRITYLIKNNGLSFAEAKQQARTEVLNIFSFALPGNISTESLNMADDALLLAVSVIVQGYLSTGDMSELLANISADIRTDGKLDNPVLGSQLMNNAAYIDMDQVKANMDKKYSGFGIPVNVNSDELKNYVQQFMNNCGFEQTLFITYPETGKYGYLNLLGNAMPTTTTYEESNYTIKVDLPEGAKLKVVLKGNNVHLGGDMGRADNDNWTVIIYDPQNHREYAEIETEEGGKTAETFTILLHPYESDVYEGSLTIEYYENGATIPTKIKELNVIKSEEE